MAAVPIKFRCYHCNQLLGVSRAKIGATVACPRCGTELIVPPAPSNMAEYSAIYSNSTATAGLLDSGVGLEFLDIRPEDIRAEPGIVVEPDEPPSIVIETEAPPVAVAPPPPSSPPSPVERPVIPVPALAPEPAPPRPIEPVPIFVERGPSHRVRDIVMSRSTVSLWMLFVLIAQAFAFLAGLLAGHYVWRVH